MKPHAKDCRCITCRVSDEGAPPCTKRPRCLAQADHEGACTTLRHVPVLLLKAVVLDIARWAK